MARTKASAKSGQASQAQAGQAAQAAQQVEPTQEPAGGEAEDEDENVLALALVGSFRSKVVGVRYYAGEASRDEMVLMVREPDNPYDRWAIRVDNIRGEKIGHISREQASTMSPLMDKGMLVIEGVVQGAKGAYTMPIDIVCFAPPIHVAATGARLRSGGIPLNAAGAGAGGGAGAAARVTPMAQSELDNCLDRMFDEVHTATPLQAAMEPDSEVLSRLYPHQRVALAWMVGRENRSLLPPFWEAKSGAAGLRFHNSLTNFATGARPEPLRGGILADDMGLGKTLIIIALIATNRPGVELPPTQLLDLGAADTQPGQQAQGRVKEEEDQEQQAGEAEAKPQQRRKQQAQKRGGESAKEKARTSKGKGKAAREDDEDEDTEVEEDGSEEEEDAPPVKRRKEKAKPKPKAKAKARRRADDDDDEEEEEEEEEDEDADSEDDYAPPAKRRKGAPTKAAPPKAAPARVVVPKPAPAKAGAKKAAAASTSAGAGPSNAAAAAAAGNAPDPGAPPPLLPRVGGPRGTLVVCPVSVLSNWATQLEEHTAGNLKTYTYHGPDRSRSASFLAGHDVVLTTYSVLGADLADGRGLLGTNWLRVVLDEAHTVKNPKAKWSQAAVKLKAERKWCVTGTPIQNRLGDLFGLLTFLRLEPLHERSVFGRALERPLKAADPRAVKKLQVLMGTIAMRRTKDLRIGGRPLVVLPRKSVNLVTVHLTREDRVKYDALELQGRRVIAHALEQSTLLENYMSVLEIILRLRQVADAGCLCSREPLPLMEGMEAAPARRGQAAAALTDEERSKLVGLLTSGLQDDCPICLEPLNHRACITRCRHIYCRPCLEGVLAHSAGASCPMCRAQVALAELLDLPEDAVEQQTQAGSDVADPVAASAKVAALMDCLRAAAATPPRDGQGPIKAVVFSQFTGMLNLIGRALEAAGLPYVRLDGSTPAAKRAEVVTSFASRQPGSPVVFLASLKAGGVGMNLTAASQVHLMDPWWNPAVEEQAMDRAHRLGQTRDVEVYRYVAADTIEERMLLLQERKRELANAAFDRRSADENRQMRIDDVKLLMAL